MTMLRGMTESEFPEFLQRTVPEYAEEKARAGNWAAEESLQKAKEAFDSLLPQGLSTTNQYLFTIEDGGEAVGNIWLAIQDRADGPIGYLYDVYIAEPFQRRGIATAAMWLLENEATCLGLHALALHVFAHNTAARALYEKLGYQITNLNMSKNIPGKASDMAAA